MYRLSFIIALLFLCFEGIAQNPHGEDFIVDCRTCHSAEAWAIDIDTFVFNHDTTSFALSGQHTFVNCISCHKTLEFEGTTAQCIDCHLDIHNQTVGNDCLRCHDTENWLVDNIFELHENNGFPLLGGHDDVSCVNCHVSETHLRFDRLGNDCINCHLQDFQATESPNHMEKGFSTNCIDCHDVAGEDWSTEFINHSFFPLTEGHDIQDCKVCHLTDNFSDASPECISCHQEDFQMTMSPDHQTLGLSTDCASCHTTNPGWIPAEFRDHDNLYFPIYSGEHEGEWDACVDCHMNPNDYSIFTCIVCHTNPETDNEHDEVQGYVYEDNACLACHPNGTSDDEFDHDKTNFPLTGAHIGVNCLDCHDDGFAGTSTNCVDCHTMDFNGASNPNHQELNLSSDCINCHTTEPDWMPATFDIHDDFWVIEGAHTVFANDCVACHNGDYNNTPNTCVGCHLDDYNATEDPNHIQAQFGTDCLQCHNQSAWTPASFDHDAEFFPIYSGAHQGEWSACVECHNDPNDFSKFTCIGCHINPETDDEHDGVSGYVYEDNACLACHPSGDADMAFNHDQTNFPLTGEHIGVECLECHSDGFAGTSMDCYSCHQMDFMASLNPNHENIGIGQDCISCHTTEPNWMPATFDIHDEYYPLNGAHALIASDCIECHNGDYNNTPNTCVGCHLDDYNNTTSPNHMAAQFTTDCVTCHNENAWLPSTFDHDAQFFPIYSGAHQGEWSACIECHINPSDYSVFQCIGCHINPETDDEHEGVSGYVYEDNACFICHPNGDAMDAFDHNTTNFPLTGGHIGVDCLECHANGYVGTSMECNSCHNDDFNLTLNPNHIALAISTDCATCHTTDPGWAPAMFDNHDEYYPLTGEHLVIAGECIMCHNGDYTNTPNTCVGCHNDDYIASLSPNHAAIGIPTDCVTCHTTQADWKPATFNIHDQYYPLTGEHLVIAGECIMCHNGDYTNTPNTCVGCHNDDYTASLNPNHAAIGIPTDCVTCHTTQADWKPATFDLHDQYYPLTGEHLVIAGECVICHNGDYANTPNTCVGCHNDDYVASINPNHIAIGIPNDCVTCHTTEPNWMPATFDIHDQYYPLNGAHAVISDQCVTCHNGDYTNTPNTCVGCHLDDYNSTTNPNHVQAQFSTDCLTCHTESSWVPATFDHDAQYFPIYSGAHMGEWNACMDCHLNPNNFAEFICISCHVNPETDDEHVGVGGYVYDDFACLACHPTGESSGAFDHNATAFPLTGAHLDLDCLECHSNGFPGTPIDCNACHMDDFNASVNPNHSSLGIPMDCETCHTTEPGWMPATFVIHDDYYELTGAHLDVADQCIICHNGDYNNTPNTCNGCHIGDYNGTTNPDHQSLGLPISCDVCHTTDPDWMPATFDIHDDYYQLNGAHALIADQCVDCHNGDYNNTLNTCVGCHQDDYNDATDPDHQTNNLSTDCLSCHNEDAWVPSDFDHDNFWVLNGAHGDIANDCFACHMGSYNNTPTDCIGCHLDDYNNTTNPDHSSAMFPTDCILCHEEDAWTPSTFDHDGMYFPIYSGKHEGEWSQCIDCHTIPTDYTMFSCIDCHEHDNQNDVDDDHDGVSGYIYESNACYSCHPTGEE